MNPALSALLWIALKCAGLIASLLPRSVELRLGPPLGRLFLRLDPKRRRIAHENMRRCLPDLDEAGLRDLLRRNYEHYGILALEILHFFSPIPGHYRRYIKRVSIMEGFDNFKRAHARGKGTILVSAHLANWEMAASQAAMHGMPLTMVTRRLKPEWLHHAIERARLSTGVHCAFIPNTLPAILKALRHGDAVAFAADQYAPPPAGIPVPFFGITVDTLSAAAPLAQRCGAAILPAYQLRDSRGLVHIHIEPELEIAPGEDTIRIIRRLSGKVEEWIRAEPSQWLWVHRRFKNVSWTRETAR